MKILMLIILITLAPIHHALSIEIPIGETAPDFTLKNIKGELLNLNEFKGTNIVLIYWKDNHDFSYEALIDYKSFYETYKKRGVQFIGIAGETGNQELVNRIVKELNIKFPVLLDTDRRVLGSYGIRVYPTTLLIGQKGNLIYSIPGHPVIYKILLDGYLRYVLGDINEEELKKAISLKKTKADKSEIMAERSYNLALKFSEMGLINRAIKTVKTALINKPDMIQAHNLLGFLYLQSKESDNAINEFKNALKIDPNSFDAKSGIGMACLARGEINYAITILTEAAILDKKSSMVYYELGKAYELKGDKDTALSMYRKSLHIAEDQRLFNRENSLCN